MVRKRPSFNTPATRSEYHRHEARCPAVISACHPAPDRGGPCGGFREATRHATYTRALFLSEQSVRVTANSVGVDFSVTPSDDIPHLI